MRDVCGNLIRLRFGSMRSHVSPLYGLSRLCLNRYVHSPRTNLITLPPAKQRRTMRRCSFTSGSRERTVEEGSLQGVHLGGNQGMLCARKLHREGNFGPAPQPRKGHHRLYTGAGIDHQHWHMHALSRMPGIRMEMRAQGSRCSSRSTGR